jgi:hypothetical protein
LEIRSERRSIRPSAAQRPRNKMSNRTARRRYSRRMPIRGGWCLTRGARGAMGPTAMARKWGRRFAGAWPRAMTGNWWP